jgi:hypothetical protein
MAFSPTIHNARPTVANYRCRLRAAHSPRPDIQARLGPMGINRAGFGEVFMASMGPEKCCLSVNIVFPTANRLLREGSSLRFRVEARLWGLRPFLTLYMTKHAGRI